MNKKQQDALYQKWLKSDELEPPDALLEPYDEDIDPETQLTPEELAQAQELGSNLYQLIRPAIWHRWK